MLRNTRVMTQEQCNRKQQQQRQQQDQEEVGGKKRKKALKPPPTPDDFGRIFLALQLVDCCAMEGTVSPEQLRVRMMRTLLHTFSFQCPSFPRMPTLRPHYRGCTRMYLQYVFMC